MLSAILAIGTFVALIAGVAYFVFTYAPYVIDFVNGILAAYPIVSAALPDCLVAYSSIPLILAVVGLLIKVL